MSPPDTYPTPLVPQQPPHSAAASQAEPKSKQPASTRGFAGMDRERQAAIASKGGKAAHQKGTAHEFTSEEAASAGRKGGFAVSQNREHMAEIGRKGGQGRAKNAKQREQEEAAQSAVENLSKSASHTPTDAAKCKLGQAETETSPTP